MFPNDLFSGLSGKRIRDVRACVRAYSFALELFDKHVTLPSARNAHYEASGLYRGLMQLSMNGGYAESTMEDMAVRCGLESPCGGAFLYRLKKLSYDEWYSRLRGVNDAILSMLSRLGLLVDRPVTCAVDYTKVPYYGRFNRYVVRSKHKDGTNRFYEYATISIVQDGLRICVYSMPVTLLDVKVDVVKKLMEEAERRGVKIKLVLLDRAFFTTACINLLKDMAVDFITPCVCNERVQGAVDSLGKEEGVLPFSIHDNDSKKKVASFTMVVYWSKRKGKLIPFATNIRGSAKKKLVGTIPREYKKRWGIETSFRKVKEVYGRTLSPSPAIRLAYFMTAMILYNLWQAINIMLRADDDEDVAGGRKRRKKKEKENGYRVTMPFMVTIFCAYLNCRV
jgi:DDE family transposase